jgi:hypothetical protein
MLGWEPIALLVGRPDPDICVAATVLGSRRGGVANDERLEDPSNGTD